MTMLEELFSQKLAKIEESMKKSITMDFSSEWQSDVFGKLPTAISKQFIQNLIEPKGIEGNLWNTNENQGLLGATARLGIG